MCMAKEENSHSSENMTKGISSMRPRNCVLINSLSEKCLSWKWNHIIVFSFLVLLKIIALVPPKGTFTAAGLNYHVDLVLECFGYPGLMVDVLSNHCPGDALSSCSCYNDGSKSLQGWTHRIFLPISVAGNSYHY